MVGASGIVALLLLIPGSGGARPVDLLEADGIRGVFRARVDSGETAHERTRLLAWDGAHELRWCRLTARMSGAAEFRSEARAHAATQAGRTTAKDWRGWLIRGGLNGTVGAEWPTECTVFAEILETGPALRSAWLEIDPSWGVSVGDTWWVRLGGQPVARLETRLTEGARAFCTVSSLVSDLTLRAGDRAALWPGPGDRARERIRTALVFVQHQGESTMAWLAAPAGIEWPSEPRCDVYRAGRFIAHLIVESRDERFWYARPMFAAEGESMRVGDDVVVQSRRDLLERRTPARIFGTERDGWLASIGEIDDVPASARFDVWRHGNRVGQAEIRKIQRAYSIVRPTEFSPPLAMGDALWLTKREPFRRDWTVARLTEFEGAGFVGEVTDDTLAQRIGQPMALRRDGRCAGVGIVVAVADGKCVGYAIEASLSAELRVGMELVAEPEQ